MNVHDEDNLFVLLCVWVWSKKNEIQLNVNVRFVKIYN